MSNARLVALGMLLGILAFGQAEKEYSANGTVRNARTGEPVQDVVVSIAKMPTANQISDPFSGVPWDPHGQEVSSGPAGEFRFEGLPAGLYVYEAQKPGFVLYRGSITLPEPSPDAAVQVDLIPEPPLLLFKIRGKVQGYLAPKAVNLELLGGTHRTNPSRTLFDASTGEFTILDVAPGEYRLRATQEKMRGEVKVSVGRNDLSGVSIALLLPRTVLGAMRAVGGRADAIRLQNPCNVNLSQDWPPRPGAAYVPRWQQDGKFTLEQQDGPFILEDVLPGEYQVHFICFGAYIQSASFGGADLLTNPALTIPAEGSLPSLEIDYTPGGGSLRVKFTESVPPLGAVLLVPDFLTATGPELKRAIGFGTGQPDDDMVQFSNLAPGDYMIYTFPKFEDVEFRKPAFLRALSGGTRVHIEDGEIAELTIAATSSTPTVRRVPLH